MDSFLRLANRLFEVVVANLTMVETWGFYLADRENGDVVLRNKLGTVWLCSLLDTLEAESRFLPDIAKEAEEHGFRSLIINAEQLQNFCVLVGEVLNQYSREEQLFLQDLRNQWVHSYLANRHRQRISVKYASSGRILCETISWDEYHSLIRPLYDAGPLDATLRTLMDRSLNFKSRYWHAIAAFQRDRERIYEIFRNGEVISIDV